MATTYRLLIAIEHNLPNWPVVEEILAEKVWILNEGMG